jgi:hypothetical protein
MSQQSSGGSVADELRKLADLEQQGFISRDEFDQQKEALLRGDRGGTEAVVPVSTKTDPTAASRINREQGYAWVFIIIGALVAIASFLPWSTASVGVVSVNRNGMQLGPNLGFSIDGVIALILGLLVALVGITSLTRTAFPRWVQTSPIVLGIGVVILAIVDLSTVNSYVSHLHSEGLTASVGYGLWIVLIGGIIAILFGAISWVEVDKQTPGKSGNSSSTKFTMQEFYAEGGERSRTPAEVADGPSPYRQDHPDESTGSVCDLCHNYYTSQNVFTHCEDCGSELRKVPRGP